jgi:hypothetical protein
MARSINFPEIRPNLTEKGRKFGPFSCFRFFIFSGANFLIFEKSQKLGGGIDKGLSANVWIFCQNSY